MSQQLVTVATFTQGIDAHLARLRLESEGIECVVADEHTVGANWLYSNAVGGVKLQVSTSDVERATGILSREPVFATPQVPESTEDDGDPRCPNCNSTDVSYERFARRVVFVCWLFLGIPLLFLKRKWKGLKCTHQWKAK